MNKENDSKNLYYYLSNKITVEFFLKILFWLSFVFILYINLRYLSNPILDKMAFRQTQTALTAYYLQVNGFSFDYETPALGMPWSIPFEFPIYQFIVAILSSLLKAPLSEVGKVVGLSFSILTLIPIFSILRNLKITKRATYIIMALYLSSPIYLFWSGTFMIESTALFFSFCFLYYETKIFQRNWSNKNIILSGLFLLLAMLQKITTVAPILIVACTACTFFSYQLGDLKRHKFVLFKIYLSLVIPVGVGLLWVFYTDSIKASNPISQALTSSSLSAWNYGSLEQRLSLNLWYEVIFKRNVEPSSFYIFGTIFIFLSLLFLRDKNALKIALISSLLFILPYILFTNLQIQHDYYQNSSTIFLVITLGICISYICDQYLLNRYKIIYMVIVIIFLSSNIFYYYKYQDISKSTLISENNNRTLSISRYIKSHTSTNDRIIIYGYDWSSEVPYYSERKALSIPPWAHIDEVVLSDTNKFFGSERIGALVLCPNPNYDFNKIKQLILLKFPLFKNENINDCEIFSP